MIKFNYNILFLMITFVTYTCLIEWIETVKAILQADMPDSGLTSFSVCVPVLQEFLPLGGAAHAGHEPYHPLCERVKRLRRPVQQLTLQGPVVDYKGALTYLS